MMRAMPGLHPAFAAAATDSGQLQGSSGTKVLADYAAMSAEKNPHSISTPSPLIGAGRGEGISDAANVISEPLSPALSHKGRESEMLPREIGGREGPEPTRFGDWEKSGRCIDF